MPYIKSADRESLDPLIDELAERLVDRANLDGNEASFAGLLNYSCTRLALAIVKKRFGRFRYWILATTRGVFKDIADELYRRVGSPYEDVQIRKNGDVDLYEEFAEQIGKM